MENGPMMRIYKPRIISFTNYHQMKSILYTNPLYEKLPSLLGDKLVQVLNPGDFIFVAPMSSKADGGIDLMDLCDDHGITA